MNQSGIRFTILGIPIEIKPAFLILGVLLYSMVRAFDKTLELMVWAFLALLVHELGHALAFRRYGLFPRIEMHALGGAAIVSGGEYSRLNNGQRFWVAFAGPLGSFLLGGVFLLIITQLGGLPKLTLTAREAEVFPLFFTLGWGLLNLLPILPLDGGQILQNLLEYIPKINAEKIAAWVGVVVCSLLLIYVLMNFSLWNLMLVGMLLANNVQRLRSTGRIGTFVPAKKEAKTSTSRTEVDRMEDQFNLGFTDDALRLALNILEKTRNKKHRAAALKVAGRAYLKLGRLDEAEAFAANNPDFEEEVPELKIALMRYQGASKAAATFAEQAYASQASPELAKAFLHLLAQTGQLERFQAFFAKTQSQPQADGVAAFAVETLLAEKEAALAITVGESLFSKAPRGKHAFLIAQGYAQSNNEAETLRWLDQAKDKGFEVKERLPHLPEFAFLADHPAFQRFR